MVKHVVMWKLKDESEIGSKSENIEKAKEILLALNGQIPGLLKLEVGEDFVGSDASADFCLVSEHESKDALEVYRTHPKHVKAAQFVGSIVCWRQSADFEV